MKLIDKVIYPIIVAVILVFYAAAVSGLGLNYAGMFSNLTTEHISFFITILVITGFLAWHLTYLHCRKKYDETNQKIEACLKDLEEMNKLKDTYKTELEARDSEDTELEILREVHRYKKASEE